MILRQFCLSTSSLPISKKTNKPWIKLLYLNLLLVWENCFITCGINTNSNNTYTFTWKHWYNSANNLMRVDVIGYPITTHCKVWWYKVFSKMFFGVLCYYFYYYYWKTYMGYPFYIPNLDGEQHPQNYPIKTSSNKQKEYSNDTVTEAPYPNGIHNTTKPI